MTTKNHGFTLIEALILAAIVAILAALLWPYLAGYECRRYETKTIMVTTQIGRSWITGPQEQTSCVEWDKGEK